MNEPLTNGDCKLVCIDIFGCMMSWIVIGECTFCTSKKTMYKLWKSKKI